MKSHVTVMRLRSFLSLRQAGFCHVVLYCRFAVLHSEVVGAVGMLCTFHN